MSNIKEFISVLDDFQKGRPLYEHLNKGLDKKTIEHTIMTAYNLDYPIDPHIVELYAWHNGISKEFPRQENVTIGDLWFFNNIVLLSLEESMELGRMITNDFLSREPDEPRYFYNDPENILSLFTSHTGRHHFVFLDDYSQKGYTPVWKQDSPLYINRPDDDFSDYIQIFDSIETMLLTFYTAITQKAVWGIPHEINRIEYVKIGTALNPQSELWKYNQYRS